MPKNFQKTKPNAKDHQIVREVLATGCECFKVKCCPCPHLYLESINGDGIDYHWNDSGTWVAGTKEEFEAACEATKIV